jgi:hypothetical protein
VVDGSYDRERVVPHGIALFQCHGWRTRVEFGVDGSLWISGRLHESVWIVGCYSAPVSAI